MIDVRLVKTMKVECTRPSDRSRKENGERLVVFHLPLPAG
jgi:hypothetical protein